MPAPTVSSISPSSGPLGGGVSVTITGNNFTGATGVTIGGTAATSVTVASDTSITCTTPAHSAGTASVLVTTPDGTNSANTLYTYLAAPTVSAISPIIGPLSGGATATITGTNFVNGATSVTIGGTAATVLSVPSGTSLTCTLPAHTAGTASVLVTTAGGTNSANSLYTYIAAPTVTAISPVSGASAGGTSVTITGTNFTSGSSVSIGGQPASSVSVVSSTSITCTTHSGSAGLASVVVTSAGGSNGANTLFTYLGPPTVSGISPSSGPITGGTSVTLTGTYFTGATGVSIGGETATNVSVVSQTSLTCTLPAHAAGTASVLVTTPEGTNGANTLFTYVVPPTVTNISPATGSSAGGTVVTITGTNFTGATGVTIRDQAATMVSVVNSTTISCITPAGGVGTASVVVTTPGGSNAANSLFSYMPPPPTIDAGEDAVSPSTGSTLGGTRVTILGANFTGAGTVTIGGVPATNVTVVDSGTITCIAPAGSVGAVSVIITTPSGSNDPNTLFGYEVKAPVINPAYDPDDDNDPPPPPPGIWPVSGSAEGGTSVTINGIYFTGTTSVTIGGVAATHVSVVNDNVITCVTPAGTAGVAKSVVVTTSPGNKNGANTLFLHVASLPTVLSVSPPIGASTGGTSVTITGIHLGAATGVTIGGAPATGIAVVNDTTINCTVPAGVAGPASVLVTSGTGTSPANSLYQYVLGVPTDTYIYLKGGRGDGFVPKWIGTLTEEGMVSDNGTILGTAGREVSEPYRDVFPSSTVSQEYGSYGFYFSMIPYMKGGMGTTFYPDEAGQAANSGKGRLSDEVAHVKPRQFVRATTWMIFISQNGLPYKFRKDLVLGWGSQPRG